IVRKTAECKLPVIRLADIPVKLPSENSAVMKVAIKPRPQKQSQVLNNANSNSGKKNSSKSVEERKEEYNRARARIFNSTNNGGTVGGKPECETRQQDNSFNGSSGFTRGEDKYASVSDVSSSRGMIGSSTNTGRGVIESSTYTSRGLVEPSTNTSRGLIDSSTNTSRGLVDSSTNTSRARSRTEKESVGRYRQSNRVAIFRDREIDRKDPDYDRSYD
ncbi:R3H domain-containing protein, partial [Trifolium medium]|nr:R3H domain-containing protein [Trifolium medium]